MLLFACCAFIPELHAFSLFRFLPFHPLLPLGGTLVLVWARSQGGPVFPVRALSLADISALPHGVFWQKGALLSSGTPRLFPSLRHVLFSLY